MATATATVFWPLPDPVPIARAMPSSRLIHEEGPMPAPARESSPRRRSSSNTYATAVQTQQAEEVHHQQQAGQQPRSAEPGVEDREDGSDGETYQDPDTDTDMDMDMDLSAYPPPSDALAHFPSSTPEPIREIIESALENITQQIRLEKQRADEAAAEAAAQLLAEQEAEALRQAEGAAEEAGAGAGSDAKGKGVDSSRPSAESHASADGGQDGGGQIKPRSRFKLRRMFHHIIERGESSAAAAPGAAVSSRDAAHYRGKSSSAAVPPSAFTQFIYKHIHARAAAAAAAEPEPEDLTCVSCFEDLKPKEGVKTVCHVYCKPCFEMLITTAIENQAQWPPKCCLNPVPYRTITKHASRDLVRRYEETREELSIPAENRIYCSAPDCGEWIRSVDRATQTARCRQGHAMCVLCRRSPPHPPGGECPRDTGRQLVERLAEEEGWRRCIDCRILVEHREACQHMTCRCGAQFCYVCGARWRSCACSAADLAVHKQLAARRRAHRQASESAEEAWLRNALRLIEEYEAEEERKREEARAAAAARREERRRRRAEARARREEERLAELAERYDGWREILVEVESVQRAVLMSAHEKEAFRAAGRTVGERGSLASEQEHELAQLRASTAEQVRRVEEELEREYRARLGWEKQLEAEYGRVLGAFCRGKAGGEHHLRLAMAAYMRKNDERWRAWCRWRDGELERARYAAEEELAVREELMEAMRHRQNEMLAARERELRRRHVAEERWLELVVAERMRLLAEMETVERESGGENDDESVVSATDDEAI